ncbi:MAG: site-2 protease family protein [Kofleriaceae bacterium]
MNISPDDIRWIFIYLFVLLISIALHEFGHAFMAHKLGDDTPNRQGRVTLNPLAHADPIGTFLLPLMGGLYGAATHGGGGGFGWGKPVQWQPSRVRRTIRMSTAQILVSFAGPLMNVVLATVLAVTLSVLLSQGVIAYGGEISQIFYFAIVTNFVLFFFNLLPVPPLDGGHIAQSFMPYKYRSQFDEFARYGPFIILGFMLIPQMRMLFVAPALWCANNLTHGLHSLFV